MITRPSTIRHNNATHSPTHQPTPRTHLPHPQPSSVQHVFDETAKYRYDMVLYSTAVQKLASSYSVSIATYRIGQNQHRRVRPPVWVIARVHVHRPGIPPLPFLLPAFHHPSALAAESVQVPQVQRSEVGKKMLIHVLVGTAEQAPLSVIAAIARRQRCAAFRQADEVERAAVDLHGVGKAAFERQEPPGAR